MGPSVSEGGSRGASCHGMASTTVKIINTRHLGFLPSAWADPCVDPGPDPERGGMCMEDDMDDDGRSVGSGGASWEVGGDERWL